MFSKDFDCKEYKEEFLEKINYDTYLADNVDFETEMNYVLDAFYQDETKYDTDKVKMCIDLMYTILKKICAEKLNERSDGKEIVTEMSYIDIIREFMGKTLEKDDWYNMMYNRFNVSFTQAIAVINKRVEQKELFKINHPNVSQINKKNIVLTYTSIVAVVVFIFMIKFFSVWISGAMEGFKTDTDIAGKIFFGFLGIGFPIIFFAIFIAQVIGILKWISKFDKK